METNKEYLASLLANLKKPIPHQWRVQSYSKNKPSATVMAYIDARDAMEVLDTYCLYGWQREHYLIDKKVYCKVGINMPDGSIQWRSDCGTESNQDAEKGQASDSFKRACVNFGIGRFLYDLPIQYVTADAIKGSSNEEKAGKKYKIYPNCINDRGQIIYNMTDYINGKNPNAPKAPELVLTVIQRLENAKDLQELAAIYTALTPDEKKANEKLKNELKEKLTLTK